MAYQSDTVATIISRLNTQHFLPAIQREFVWGPEKILKLFDSILRNYPISSFLFWELHQENRDRWDVYEFIDNFHQAHPHNELAATDGVQQLNLVLDGQQRLTSLLVGLKGSYTEKTKYGRWDNPQAFIRKSLYLNLLKDPRATEDDDDEGLYYGLAFHPAAPAQKDNECWIKVGRILDFDSEDKFYEFRQEVQDKLPDTTTKAQVALLGRNLERLYRAVWKDDFISYYTEHDQDYDRVLDIFVRANEGGTKLSKSDLLLSMVTLRWQSLNARNEIYSFVDRMNEDLTRKNNFDKDFVMKACLVLSDLPVKYRVDNFNNQNLATIERNWNRIRSALEMTVDLANRFGIDRDNLISTNALIPVAYFVFRHGVDLRGTERSTVKNAEAVRRWLTSCLLNNVFGGSSDTILTSVRQVLQDMATSDFPVEAINAKLAETNRSAQFDENAIDNFLDITYGTRPSFLGLSLLRDDRAWGTMTFHQDHIFPKSLFTTKSLTDAGIPEEKHWTYITLGNRIGNLQLLSAPENSAKSDQNFEEWLKTRDRGFRERQLIPEDESLYSLDRFEDFVTAREELIRERLEDLLSEQKIAEVA